MTLIVGINWSLLKLVSLAEKTWITAITFEQLKQVYMVLSLVLHTHRLKQASY